MEISKEEVNNISQELLQRLECLNSLFTEHKNKKDFDNVDKCVKISEYLFLSTAIENLIKIAIQYLCSSDFINLYIENKFKYSGYLIAPEYFDKLILELGYKANSIKIKDVKEYFNCCEQQVSHAIARQQETYIDDNETIKDLYSAIRDQRNGIAHTLVPSILNISEGMLLKYFKIFYCLFNLLNKK